MELMKLKPPPNITTPVATATGTGLLVLCLNTDLCLSWKREENKCLYMHHRVACLMKTGIKSIEKTYGSDKLTSCLSILKEWSCTFRPNKRKQD